ncbi:MAG TPA: MtnX-like HAD-IB family phosphatase [Bacteroidota bacterium]|nr:MtnX-like HAD-IB family phosphatase [Bacteroidota bacterium]
MLSTGETIKIFIDFDGTVANNDVGDQLFERFGGQQSVDAVREYLQGTISAVSCFRKECDSCGVVDREVLDGFLEHQTIDESFPAFVEFCRRQNIDHCILSDGMDYYIRKILSDQGLSDVPFFSNTLTLHPENHDGSVRFVPSFPYTDETCDRCASCKRNHILSLCADSDIIIYVGEGYSDRCPSRYADIIFAKDELLKYCRQEGIPSFEYRRFADIQHRLESMIDERSHGAARIFRKRRQAVLAWKDLLKGG